MTDTLASMYPDRVHQTEEARKRRRARKAVEARFRFYGLAAIAVAVLALGVLLASMVGSGFSAFWQHSVKVELMLDESEIDPDGTREDRTLLRYNYNSLFRDWLKEKFPHVEGRQEIRKLYGLLSSGAPVELRAKVMDDPSILGQRITLNAPLSDDMDVYLKGDITDVESQSFDQSLAVSADAPAGEPGTVDDAASAPEAPYAGTITFTSSFDAFEGAYLAVKEYYRNLAEKDRAKAADLRSRTEGVERDIQSWIRKINRYAASLPDQAMTDRLANDSFNWEARIDRIIENLTEHYAADGIGSEVPEELTLGDGSAVWDPLIENIETRLPDYEVPAAERTDDAGEAGPRLPTATELATAIEDLQRLLKNAAELEVSSKAALARADDLAVEEELTDKMPSFLVEINEGIVRLNSLTMNTATGDAYTPLQSLDDSGDWTLVKLVTPESARRLNDKEITWMRALENEGLVVNEWNRRLLFNSDSREPELAGIWGAVVGSFYTMVVTLVLSFPVAIMAAIYLEEYAPKNRFTDFIEVNINNLAAVPSIVFGLLGLAVFINTFGLPRSAPLVGGMVLALMTLPTIIIAARASLKAVPPSIREAAMGVGASPVQTVFHHVLPLAMPGILTGTIIGMAQALGETAPLLMIGMVAFVSDIPDGFTSPAAALPVQIFLWADSPERAFVERTSAAIIILLTFLILMNIIAVILRRRFERRW